jgi:thiol-disulfide isomerase/thioredoxin
MIQRFACCLAIVSLVVVAGILRADDPKATEDDGDGPGFVVRVVNEQDQPVKGARVTTYSSFDEKDSVWKFFPDIESDADGLARFTSGSANLDYSCVGAFDLPRNLVGIASLQPKGPWDPVPKVVMHRGCKVSGKLISTDLAKRGKPLGWTNIYVDHDNKNLLAYSRDNPSGESEFELLLPPGEYQLKSYGSHLHFLKPTIAIKPGQDELRLDPMDLPATRLALLEGESVPPLREVVAWKNGPGVELSDLRGKFVLLEFWGYWCGPCVASMPELMEFYDQHKEQGLVVVGVHVDILEKPGAGAVDTADKLNKKLEEVRKELWHGRDIPFPVALTKFHQVPYGPRVSGKVGCQASADFGIMIYPTQVLIDRNGKVVGKCETRTAEGRERLAKLLEK